jgi:hypothetical protein
LQAILKRKVALLDAELAKASTTSETSGPEQLEKPTFVRRRDKKTIDKQQKQSSQEAPKRGLLSFEDDEE